MLVFYCFFLTSCAKETKKITDVTRNKYLPLTLADINHQYITVSLAIIKRVLAFPTAGPTTVGTYRLFQFLTFLHICHTSMFQIIKHILILEKDIWYKIKTYLALYETVTAS